MLYKPCSNVIFEHLWWGTHTHTLPPPHPPQNTLAGMKLLFAMLSVCHRAQAHLWPGGQRFSTRHWSVMLGWWTETKSKDALKKSGLTNNLVELYVFRCCGELQGKDSHTVQVHCGFTLNICKAAVDHVDVEDPAQCIWKSCDNLICLCDLTMLSYMLYLTNKYSMAKLLEKDFLPGAVCAEHF